MMCVVVQCFINHCLSLSVIFFIIALSVPIQFTTSYYHFGIVKIFLKVNSCGPKVLAVPVSLITPVVLLLNNTNII
jgi:hypothetical protein